MKEHMSYDFIYISCVVYKNICRATKQNKQKTNNNQKPDECVLRTVRRLLRNHKGIRVILFEDIENILLST